VPSARTSGRRKTRKMIERPCMPVRRLRKMAILQSIQQCSKKLRCWILDPWHWEGDYPTGEILFFLWRKFWSLFLGSLQLSSRLAAHLNRRTIPRSDWHYETFFSRDLSHYFLCPQAQESLIRRSWSSNHEAEWLIAACLRA